MDEIVQILTFPASRFDAGNVKRWCETCWKKRRRTGKYGEHFYETLQPNRLHDFATKNRSVQVKGVSLEEMWRPRHLAREKEGRSKQVGLTFFVVSKGEHSLMVTPAHNLATPR